MERQWLSNIFILSLLATPLAAQQDWTFRTYGGIGIGVASMPALADYANVVGGAGGEKVEDFQSVFDLNGGVEINIDDGWTIGLEYVSSGRTIETNPTSPGSGWRMEPSLQMPTLVIRKMYGSGTMTYGFGGGIGYHYGKLHAIPPGLLSGTTYAGAGPGVLAEAVAHTYFDQSFAGMIAVDVRWSSIAELTDENGVTPRTGNGVVATLKTFLLSLRFGVSFQL